MPIHALNHVGFSSPDLPRLVAFYRDLFGFAEVTSFSWPVGTTAADEGLGLVDSSADVTILNAGNLYLELFCFHTPEPAPQSPDRPVQDGGLSRLAVEVDDVDAVTERLRAAGVRVIAEATDRADGTRVAAVRDPDGNLIELQRSAPGSATWAGNLGVVATPPVGADDTRRTVAPSGGVLGVNLVGLTTDDLDAHAAFYRDAAGLTPVAHGPIDPRPGPDAAGEQVVLGFGNVHLDLVRYDRPTGAPLDPDRPINDHGLNHLCFDVSDLDGLHARMVEGGMTYDRAPALMPAGHTAMGYARDPFGIPLEFVENRSSSAFLWCGHLRDLLGAQAKANS